MSGLEVNLLGQIDGGKHKINFKFISQNNNIDVLLVFLLSRLSPECSVSMVVKPLHKVQDVPMNFEFLTGTGCVYCLEVFGVQSTDDSARFKNVAFARKEFSVTKDSQDKHFLITLSDSALPSPPLLNSCSDNWDFEIDHTPLSTYTLSGARTCKKEKIWIVFFQQTSDTFFFVLPSKKLCYKLPFELIPAKTHKIKVVSGFVLYKNDSLKLVGNEINTKLKIFKSCFTVVEYQKLLKVTTDYIKSLNGRFCAIEYLYRNKSEMYYSAVDSKKNI